MRKKIVALCLEKPDLAGETADSDLLRVIINGASSRVIDSGKLLCNTCKTAAGICADTL